VLTAAVPTVEVMEIPRDSGVAHDGRRSGRCGPAREIPDNGPLANAWISGRTFQRGRDRGGNRLNFLLPVPHP